MTETKILTDEQIESLWGRYADTAEAGRRRNAFARAIEQAVLQSPEVRAWKKDAERIDWLADSDNEIGGVYLPTEIVTNNIHSLRDAIDAAMEVKPS